MCLWFACGLALRARGSPGYARFQHQLQPDHAAHEPPGQSAADLASPGWTTSCPRSTSSLCRLPNGPRCSDPNASLALCSTGSLITRTRQAASHSPAPKPLAAMPRIFKHRLGITRLRLA
jgi:hypothetical protein